MNIQSIMEKATSAVEFMYDKTAEVQRYVDYTKPNGADGQCWKPIHENIPCRLSSINLSNTAQGDANVINYDTKLFLSSTIDVLAGDRVIVSILKDGKKVDSIKFESAKEPFVYISHQEVLLIRKDYA